MLSINTNLSSLITQTGLNKSTNLLNQAIERMSTGYKINHSKDNAANYSISTNQTTKIGAYQVAEQNATMGLDMVKTGSETIAQMENQATRLRSLIIQARNGTYGGQSLNAIQAEANAITSEIDRLYNTAEYNGISLFTGGTENVSATAEVAMFATPRATTSEGYFIKHPISYTNEEVKAMTTMTELASGVTSATKEYSISTKEELVALANYVNSGKDTTGMTFVLGADIDLLSISNWTPIGNYSANTSYQFKGTFDGNGQLIKNLTIDDETKDRQGLFGRASSQSKIQNVGLEGVNIKGKAYVGGLVGDTYGLVSNCYTTGTIKGDSRVGGLTGFSSSSSVIDISYTNSDVTGTGNYVGGLVGEVYGSVTSCYTTGIIKGAGRVGGLAGFSSSSSGINNSYTNGDVVGTGNYVGGLIGEAYGSVNNSYTTGMIKGVARVGGIAGFSSSTSTITNSYAKGDITGTSNYIGGLIGETHGSTSNSYSTGVVTGTAGASSIANSTDWNGVNFTYNYKTASYSGNSFSITDNGDESRTASFMLQIGISSDNSCQIGFDMNFSYDLSVLGIDISSDEALDAIDDFIEELSLQSTKLGAVQNRLESVLDEIGIQYENLVSSRSTIRDADIAKVSSRYIQQQILQQASATLMATANQSPSIALQLI